LSLPAKNQEGCEAAERPCSFHTPEAKIRTLDVVRQVAAAHVTGKSAVGIFALRIAAY
jgi:hypothetical protein